MNVREYALLLLKFRPRSRKELYSRLRRKGYSEEEIEKALQWLEESGFIDEMDMAIDYVRAGVERGWSRMRIIKGLRERGIPSDIVEEALRHYDEERVVDVLREKLKGKDRESMIKFLKNRGFSWEMIRRVLSDE